MKKILKKLSVAAVLGLTVCTSDFVQAQAPATPAPAATAQPRAQRICIVNIAKVLREYNKANFQGQEITTKRNYYVTQVNAWREKLSAKNAEFQRSAIPAEKEKLQKEALEIQRQIEDIDREAQKVLTTYSNDTIVRVYQEIKGVIGEIARTNNLDLVLCYPDSSKVEDESSPTIAQLKLQTPALIPFYHRGMDITDVVIQTLNARYPSPKPTATGAAEPTDPKAPVAGEKK